MAQGWFSMSGGSGEEQEQQSGSSLLADWNSYAASRDFEESGGSFGFDIESAVRSANDTVSGTFSVVSKGVRDIPGSLQSATSSMPSGKSLMYFGLLLASGVFFIFIAFTMFLPVMVLMPQKFAICFTIGCGFIIGSFFALRGPQNQLTHMSSMEASFNPRFHCYHGWYHIRIDGSSQLHSLGALLCITGCCAGLLLYILLPWWIIRYEVPQFCSYLICTKSSREVSFRSQSWRKTKLFLSVV